MVKATGNLLASLYGRTRNWLKEPTPRGQTLPPYLLIAVLWVLNGRSDDIARERDAQATAIFSASENYGRELKIFENANNIRLDCIDGVEDHNRYIRDFHAIFEFIRVQPSPSAATFADSLQQDFDQRNPIQEIETECAPFPPPVPPEVPQILIDEGLVIPSIPPTIITTGD